MSTLEVNKITPAGSGTTVTLGDSGDSIDITSGATVTNFKSTGIDDNASSTALTIASDGRNTVDSTNEKPLIIHHSDGSTVNMGFQNNSSNAHYLGFSSSDFTVAPAGTERMRILSNGDIFFSNTTEGAIGGGSTDGKMIDNADGARLRSSRASTSTREHLVFYNPNSGVGSITTSGSSTSFNTSSDYRLKENIDYDWDATTRLKELKPARFNFKADANTTVDGFIAHEVSNIVPEAITGTHNEVDEDGNPVYQGIDQSKLVPLLTASLQEAIAKIETLETEMTALKARVTTLENV
jgi:hypothetical protein